LEWQNHTTKKNYHYKTEDKTMSNFTKHRAEMELFFAEKGFSLRTEEQYRAILKAFLEKIDIESCTATDLLDFLRSTGWGNSRQYVACGIIRQYFKWKFGEHPLLRVRVRREKAKPGRTLNEDQIRTLLGSFNYAERPSRFCNCQPCFGYRIESK